jgi:dephospho-CoA kinase
MTTLGLTGGIASGKTTVSVFFSECGALVVDADRIAHAATANGLPAWKAVVAHFGESILGPDGEIDRRRLGEIVFRKPAERKRLEVIIHPHVFAQITADIERAAADQPNALVVLDVPLLFETGMDRDLDAVAVVYVPEIIQIERLIARDGLTPEQARARIDSQMPIEEKRRRADIVIDNTGPLETTRRQVRGICRRLGR